MTKTKETVTKIVTGKYELSEKELSLAGSKLADALQSKQSLVDEQKLKNAEYKDRISQVDDSIKKLSDKLRTGEEDRDYECEVIKDEENKEKIFKDIKTKKIIKKVPFTAADYQMRLDEVEEELLDEPLQSGNEIKISKSELKKGLKKVVEEYKFQTGDWVKKPVGPAFQLKLEMMGDLPKKLRLATAEEIEKVAPKSLSESKESPSNLPYKD